MFRSTYLLFSVLPYGGAPRAVLPYAALFTLAGVILIRPVVVAVMASSVAGRRMLIIGTGPEALAVEELIESQGPAWLGHRRVLPCGVAGRAGRCGQEGQRPDVSGEPQAAGRRRALPRQRSDRRRARAARRRDAPDDLLECRVAGVPVCDLSAFYERMRGEVPVDSLKASWLIYGAGFVQNPPAQAGEEDDWTWSPATSCSLLALPVLLLAILAILLESGLPVLFRQERVGQRRADLQSAEAADDAGRRGEATASRGGQRRATRG